MLPPVVAIDERPRVRALVAALEADPGLTTAEAADRTGLPFRHAAVLLWRLEDAGAVVHEAHRWYPVER